MALQWREALERMDGYLKELLSSGLLLLHAQLGVDVGLNAELLPPGLLACVAAGLGLLLVLLLWFSVCRCFSKKTAEGVAHEAGKIFKPKSEEVKKRSRKRGGDKKVQRNGQAVDLEEELKSVENQNLSESPDPAGGKSEKGKKNKKKTKAQVKETKSASTSERREPEEAGPWETKVSQREKRQQRRKDKGAGDESGSPGGTELGTNAAVEELKIISTPSVTSKTTNITPKSSNTPTSSSTPKSSNTSTSSSTPKSSNTSTSSSTPKSSNTSTSSSTPKSSNTSTSSSTPKSSNTSTSSSTTKSLNPTTSKISNTTTTKSSNPIASNTTTTDSTKSSNPTPAPKAQKNSPRTKLVVPPVEHDPPVAEVTRAVIAPGSPAWDVIGVNGSGSWDLGVSVPPHSQTWNTVNPETSVWPQDMEGSWMMVDGSHIPVSLHGVTGGVPESSWACPAPVDDEWSGPNSGSADPASDYCAPCEEWGNYEEPAGGAVLPVEPQDSDPEKDRDELAAPGSSKTKRKKKKKKAAEETGGASQVEVGGAKDQQVARSGLPKNTKEQEVMVPPPVLLKPIEPEALPKSTAPSTPKNPEENLEPQKQVKKKKARRET